MAGRGRREPENDQAEPTPVVKVVFTVIGTAVPVALLAAAWDIATTPASECVRAIKAERRRRWDSLWTCASEQDLIRLGRPLNDGVSPTLALLFLTLVGLAAAAVWLLEVWSIVRYIGRRIHGVAPASEEGQDLVDDLDQLDDLHRRGKLSHADLVTAKRRRRLVPRRRTRVSTESSG